MQAGRLDEVQKAAGIAEAMGRPAEGEVLSACRMTLAARATRGTAVPLDALTFSFCVCEIRVDFSILQTDQMQLARWHSRRHVAILHSTSVCRRACATCSR